MVSCEPQAVKGGDQILTKRRVTSLRISKGVALGVFAVIVASSVASVAVVPTVPQPSTSTGSANSSMSSSSPSSVSISAASSDCLVDVGAPSLWRSYNSTTSGVVASYEVGAQRFFPDGQCPEPAQHNFYDVVTSVMSNPKFVAAENGSKFLFDPTSSSIGISIGSFASPDYY